MNEDEAGRTCIEHEPVPTMTMSAANCSTSSRRDQSGRKLTICDTPRTILSGRTVTIVRPAVPDWQNVRDFDLHYHIAPPLTTTKVNNIDRVTLTNTGG